MTSTEPPPDTSTETYKDPRIDDVMRRLDELADLPVERHPEVYDAVHTRLREVLSDLGEDDPPA